MTASVSEHKIGKRPGTYLIEVKTKMKNEAYHLRVAGSFQVGGKEGGSVVGCRYESGFTEIR